MKSHANGSELWERDFREDGTKLVKKFSSGSVSFELSDDEKTIFILAGGSLTHASLDKLDSAKPIAFDAVMQLRPEAERAYMFEHAWRQIKDKFYNPNFHGIDWDAMKVDYQAKLPSIANNRDLALSLIHI